MAGNAANILNIVCNTVTSLGQFTYNISCIDPCANNFHSNFIFSLYYNILKKTAESTLIKTAYQACY